VAENAARAAANAAAEATEAAGAPASGENLARKNIYSMLNLYYIL